MKRAILSLFVLLVCSAFAADDSPRMLLHLLGYLGSDYAGAVQGGKVLNQGEYGEQVEFSRTALEVAGRIEALKSRPEVVDQLRKLQQLVAEKADAALVAATAQTAQQSVIQATGLVVAPTSWPDRRHGQAIFEKQCAQCHGITGHGDGPASGNQNPPPFDFHSEKADGISPFQAFNAIRLGVPGTTMVAFSHLSDADTWDLAFYVLSLRHEAESPNPRLPELAKQASFTLEQVATQSDETLRKLLPGNPEDKAQVMAAVRLQGASPQSASSLPKAVAELKQAVSQAQEGKWDLASASAVRAYLEGVEPVEAELRSRDGSFTVELEQKMSEVRGAIQRRIPVEALQAKVDTALAALAQAQTLLSQRDSSPYFTFSIAAGIVLREAFEAVLILITLLGIIRSVGAHSALVAVHIGWISAVGVGLLAWFFSGWLIAISGAQREMLEAVTSLIAVTVLLYFGFWLHQRSEIGKWRAFIDEKVKSALDNKQLFGLAAISFMAVFREAFETVIFLRALLIEAGPAQQMAVGLGVLSAFLVVLVLAALLLRFSVRVPLRQLFAVSSFVMVLLSLILVGKAAHSFQETGILPVTSLPLSLHIDLIGLYPTYETILPQLAVVTGAALYWLYQRRLAVK